MAASSTGSGSISKRPRSASVGDDDDRGAAAPAGADNGGGGGGGGPRLLETKRARLAPLPFSDELLTSQGPPLWSSTAAAVSSKSVASLASLATRPGSAAASVAAAGSSGGSKSSSLSLLVPATTIGYTFTQELNVSSVAMAASSSSSPSPQLPRRRIPSLPTLLLQAGATLPVFPAAAGGTGIDATRFGFILPIAHIGPRYLQPVVDQSMLTPAPGKIIPRYLMTYTPPLPKSDSEVLRVFEEFLSTQDKKATEMQRDHGKFSGAFELARPTPVASDEKKDTPARSMVTSQLIVSGALPLDEYLTLSLGEAAVTMVPLIWKPERKASPLRDCVSWFGWIATSAGSSSSDKSSASLKVLPFAGIGRANMGMLNMSNRTVVLKYTIAVLITWTHHLIWRERQTINVLPQSKIMYAGAGIANTERILELKRQLEDLGRRKSTICRNDGMQLTVADYQWICDIARVHFKWQKRQYRAKASRSLPQPDTYLDARVYYHLGLDAGTAAPGNPSDETRLYTRMLREARRYEQSYVSGCVMGDMQKPTQRLDASWWHEPLECCIRSLKAPAVALSPFMSSASSSSSSSSSLSSVSSKSRNTPAAVGPGVALSQLIKYVEDFRLLSEQIVKAQVERTVADDGGGSSTPKTSVKSPVAGKKIDSKAGAAAAAQAQVLRLNPQQFRVYGILHAYLEWNLTTRGLAQRSAGSQQLEPRFSVLPGIDPNSLDAQLHADVVRQCAITGAYEVDRTVWSESVILNLHRMFSEMFPSLAHDPADARDRAIRALIGVGTASAAAPPVQRLYGLPTEIYWSVAHGDRYPTVPDELAVTWLVVLIHIAQQGDLLSIPDPVLLDAQKLATSVKTFGEALLGSTLSKDASTLDSARFLIECGRSPLLSISLATLRATGKLADSSSLDDEVETPNAIDHATGVLRLVHLSIQTPPRAALPEYAVEVGSETFIVLLEVALCEAVVSAGAVRLAAHGNWQSTNSFEDHDAQCGAIFYEDCCDMFKGRRLSAFYVSATAPDNQKPVSLEWFRFRKPELFGDCLGPVDQCLGVILNRPNETTVSIDGIKTAVRASPVAIVGFVWEVLAAICKRRWKAAMDTTWVLMDNNRATRRSSTAYLQTALRAATRDALFGTKRPRSSTDTSIVHPSAISTDTSSLLPSLLVASSSSSSSSSFLVSGIGRSIGAGLTDLRFEQFGQDYGILTEETRQRLLVRPRVALAKARLRKWAEAKFAKSFEVPDELLSPNLGATKKAELEGFRRVGSWTPLRDGAGYRTYLELGSLTLQSLLLLRGVFGVEFEEGAKVKVWDMLTDALETVVSEFKASPEWYRDRLTTELYPNPTNQPAHPDWIPFMETAWNVFQANRESKRKSSIYTSVADAIRDAAIRVAKPLKETKETKKSGGGGGRIASPTGQDVEPSDLWKTGLVLVFSHLQQSAMELKATRDNETNAGSKRRDAAVTRAADLKIPLAIAEFDIGTDSAGTAKKWDGRTKADLLDSNGMLKQPGVVDSLVKLWPTIHAMRGPERAEMLRWLQNGGASLLFGICRDNITTSVTTFKREFKAILDLFAEDSKREDDLHRAMMAVAATGDALLPTSPLLSEEAIAWPVISKARQLFMTLLRHWCSGSKELTSTEIRGHLIGGWDVAPRTTEKRRKAGVAAQKAYAKAIEVGHKSAEQLSEAELDSMVQGVLAAIEAIVKRLPSESRSVAGVSVSGSTELKASLASIATAEFKVHMTNVTITAQEAAEARQMDPHSLRIYLDRELLLRRYRVRLDKASPLGLDEGKANSYLEKARVVDTERQALVSLITEKLNLVNTVLLEDPKPAGEQAIALRMVLYDESVYTGIFKAPFPLAPESWLELGRPAAQFRQLYYTATGTPKPAYRAHKAYFAIQDWYRRSVAGEFEDSEILRLTLYQSWDFRTLELIMSHASRVAFGLRIMMDQKLYNKQKKKLKEHYETKLGPKRTSSLLAELDQMPSAPSSSSSSLSSSASTATASTAAASTSSAVDGDNDPEGFVDFSVELPKTMDAFKGRNHVDVRQLDRNRIEAGRVLGVDLASAPAADVLSIYRKQRAHLGLRKIDIAKMQALLDKPLFGHIDNELFRDQLLRPDDVKDEVADENDEVIDEKEEEEKASTAEPVDSSIAIESRIKNLLAARNAIMQSVYDPLMTTMRGEAQGKSYSEKMYKEGQVIGFRLFDDMKIRAVVERAVTDSNQYPLTEKEWVEENPAPLVITEDIRRRVLIAMDVLRVDRIEDRLTITKLATEISLRAQLWYLGKRLQIMFDIASSFVNEDVMDVMERTTMSGYAVAEFARLPLRERKMRRIGDGDEGKEEKDDSTGAAAMDETEDQQTDDRKTKADDTADLTDGDDPVELTGDFITDNSAVLRSHTLPMIYDLFHVIQPATYWYVHRMGRQISLAELKAITDGVLVTRVTRLAVAKERAVRNMHGKLAPVVPSMYALGQWDATPKSLEALRRISHKYASGALVNSNGGLAATDFVDTMAKFAESAAKRMNTLSEFGTRARRRIFHRIEKSTKALRKIPSSGTDTRKLVADWYNTSGIWEMIQLVNAADDCIGAIAADANQVDRIRLFDRTYVAMTADPRLDPTPVRDTQHLVGLRSCQVAVAQLLRTPYDGGAGGRAAKQTLNWDQVANALDAAVQAVWPSDADQTELHTNPVMAVLTEVRWVEVEDDSPEYKHFCYINSEMYGTEKRRHQQREQLQRAYDGYRTSRFIEDNVLNGVTRNNGGRKSGGGGDEEEDFTDYEWYYGNRHARTIAPPTENRIQWTRGEPVEKLPKFFEPGEVPLLDAWCGVLYRTVEWMHLSLVTVHDGLAPLHELVAAVHGLAVAGFPGFRRFPTTHQKIVASEAALLAILLKHTELVWLWNPTSSDAKSDVGARKIDRAKRVLVTCKKHMDAIGEPDTEVRAEHADRSVACRFLVLGVLFKPLPYGRKAVVSSFAPPVASFATSDGKDEKGGNREESQGEGDEGDMATTIGPLSAAAAALPITPRLGLGGELGDKHRDEAPDEGGDDSDDDEEETKKKKKKGKEATADEEEEEEEDGEGDDEGDEIEEKEKKEEKKKKAPIKTEVEDEAPEEHTDDEEEHNQPNRFDLKDAFIAPDDDDGEGDDEGDDEGDAEGDDAEDGEGEHMWMCETCNRYFDPDESGGYCDNCGAAFCDDHGEKDDDGGAFCDDCLETGAADPPDEEEEEKEEKAATGKGAGSKP